MGEGIDKKEVQHFNRENRREGTIREIISYTGMKVKAYILVLKPSGHYMYRTVVSICTAQWSQYVPPGLTFNVSTFCPHSVFMCFVWI